MVYQCVGIGSLQAVSASYLTFVTYAFYLCQIKYT